VDADARVAWTSARVGADCVEFVNVD